VICDLPDFLWWLKSHQFHIIANMFIIAYRKIPIILLIIISIIISIIIIISPPSSFR
jgi:hypothetical protein